MEMEEGEKGKTEPSKGDAKQDATETTEVSTKMERDENEKNHMKENDGKNSVGDGKPEPEPEQKPEDEAKEKDADGKSAAEQSAKVSEAVEDTKDRNVMYEEAVQLERKGKDDAALRRYLQCLEDLEANNNFKSLPQCLHKIADLYFTKEEFDKAIQFIQAEKMYYETALIDIAAFHKNLEMAKKAGDRLNKPPPESLQGQRATEYENLAKTCLDKSQPHLALEYQGKATKLRQALYGQDHPITKKSLDFFTVIYGEVGKLQYSESMQKFTENPVEDISAADKEEKPDGGDANPPGSEPSRRHSILRNRKGLPPRDRRESISKQVQFDEQTLLREQSRMQEESISRILLWGLFGMIFIVLISLIFYTYCRTHGSSRSCRDLRASFTRYYRMVQYWINIYLGPNLAVG